MPRNHTPTATDALRSWVVHAGFSIRRRDAALAALDAFDAALCTVPEPEPEPDASAARAM